MRMISEALNDVVGSVGSIRLGKPPQPTMGISTDCILNFHVLKIHLITLLSAKPLLLIAGPVNFGEVPS